MRPVFFSILLLISFRGHSQEWWDIKSHEGPDAATFNNNASMAGNLHHDPKARNKDNVDTKLGNGLFIESKATKKRIAEMTEARKLAFENLRADVLGNSSGELVSCNTCKGRGARVCTRCDGATYIDCSVCHGAPNLECRACKGGGLVNEVPCKVCDGTGKSECKFCQGKKVMCETCAGVGMVICKICSGAGSSFVVPSNESDSLKQSPSTIPRSTTINAAKDTISNASGQTDSGKQLNRKKKSN
jgi:DnaJ-class molecular chaperone